MYRPACPSLRLVVFGSLAVLCFIGIFLMYRSDVQYQNLGFEFCPAFLCAEKAQTKDTHPINSTELHNKQSNQEDPGTITSPTPSTLQSSTITSPTPSTLQSSTITSPTTSTLQSSTITSPTQKIQAASTDAEPDTIVLIWMYPFGSTFPLSCDVYNILKCQLTDDKNLYNKSNGVLFHHRNINGELVANIPKMPRLPFQKWVWFNMESPANTHPISEFNEAYNLTCSYRIDSDVPVPYGRLEPLTSEDESFKLPAKDKLVCWIVSNWNARYKRVEFFNELKKHIEIQTYGSAFGKYINHDDYSKIISSCKFYLSFENSIYTDYITEKLFRPMRLGTVPITLGPSRQIYEKQIPRDSFIHFEDFSTPKELAERLLYLDKNQTEYIRFFNWTSTFKVLDSDFGREHACRTCKYLQSHKEYQAVKDLKSWFWG